MKLAKSKLLELPEILLVGMDESTKDIPIGIPFIRVRNENIPKMIRILEYQVLLKSFIKLGFPQGFRKFLREKGFNFTDVDIVYTASVMDGTTSFYEERDFSIDDALNQAAIVDIQKLMDLDLLPPFFKTLEENIMSDVLNQFSFSRKKFNKVTDSFGAFKIKPDTRNLIIIDISGSIPSSISATMILIAVNMVERYNADLLITGSKSILYDRDDVHKLDPRNIFKEIGTDNDQIFFKKILEKYKNYNNVVLFGDYHNPNTAWHNKYNINTESILKERGIEDCNFTIEGDIISFHTTSDKNTCGYGVWFEPKGEYKNVSDWVKYF